MTPETPARWETYLRTQFPGYLLPESAAEVLTEAEASRFLEALTGKPNAFAILRNVSFIAPRMSDLLAFARRVQEFVRSLPSSSETVRRQWIGGFQGNLDLRSTLTLHHQGRRTEFVTRTPRRDFDLPENVVVRSVCERLVGLLTELRLAKALPDLGWGTGGRECEGVLRHVLAASALRSVSSRLCEPLDIMAALGARNPVFHEAARWHGDLRLHLDVDDPARIARMVAEGALLPLDAATRFEVAVAMRLIESLARALSSDTREWLLERTLIVAGRRDMAALRCGELVIRVFYNQAVLDAGATDLGVAHYFATTSRMRPDVTVTIERGDALITALVIECKHTEDPSYLITGFHEAMLYRHEYAPFLTGAVKAILVGSGSVPGVARANEEVIAVTWDAWPPNEVIASLLAGIYIRDDL
jgi:hypothetical protein